MLVSARGWRAKLQLARTLLFQFLSVNKRASAQEYDFSRLNVLLQEFRLSAPPLFAYNLRALKVRSKLRPLRGGDA
jgi:hypothetical protein